MKKALVLGGGGMLAQELIPALAAAGWQVARAAKADLDIADAAAVKVYFAKEKPDVVFNCAAYTAVDKAETDQAACFRVNAEGAGVVAREAAAIGAAVVHVSTDYAFDGKKMAPYLETDAINPMGTYARSKLDGEAEVVRAGGKHFIVRTGELYGDGGKNFFDAILGRAKGGGALKIVSDQIVTPTWTRELSRQLVVIAEKAPPGLYHATQDGEVSWLDAAIEALRISGLSVPVTPVTTADYGSPTPRPLYSALSKDKLKALGLYVMKPWKAALSEWLTTRPPR